MMKHAPIRIVLLGSLILLLQGCYWGFDGASVEIVNETNETIFAKSNGGYVSTNAYVFYSRVTIAPGKREVFTYSDLTFDPDVEVEYMGIHHPFRTTLDFFGFDRIYVHKEDFQAPSN